MAWNVRRFFQFGGRRARAEADIDREFAFHLAERIDELVSSGMTESRARQTALRQFGSVALQKDRIRDLQARAFSDLSRDIRYGIRQLRRTPVFTLVAVLSIAIGTGANIAIFGFVSALMFRPLDVDQPGQLVRVLGEGGNTSVVLATQSEAHIGAQDYFQYRDRNESFSELAGQFVGGPMRVRTDGPARIIPIMLVSGNYFETLGVPAAKGRTLVDADGKAGAPPVVMLSDEGWTRFFNRDPAVLGTTAVIEGELTTIVGIVPSWFKGTYAPMVPQIYGLIREAPGTDFRIDLIGRLKPDVSPSEARADLSRIAAQLTAQDRQRRVIEVYGATTLQPFMLRVVSLVSIVFGLVVLVVLLIACDNIAMLLLTRWSKRHREIAVRQALGASQARLVRQLLTESLLLCAVGGAIGLYLAHEVARYLTRFYATTPMPFALTYVFDWRVAIFAAAVSCGAALLCGLAPALQSRNTDVVSAIKGSGAGDGSRVRSALIVTQVTLSTALLVVAAMLARSVAAPFAPDSGFRSDGVLMSTVSVDGGYTAARRTAFFQKIVDHLEGAPGVTAVSVVDNIPLSNNRPSFPETMRSGERTERVYTNAVGPGFFRTLGIPILAGRDFAWSDDVNSAGVGIVNETLSRRFWPGTNPIGERLQLSDGSFVQVVGVAKESKYSSLDEEPKAFMYRPIAQSTVTSPTVLIKLNATAASPSAVFSILRARIAELDPDLAAYNVMTLNDRLGLGMVANRALAALSGGMGLLALALGALGIYGTMSYVVQQRRHEIGVRVALGATPSRVVALITRQGMSWTAVGLAAGSLGGAVATLLLTRVLYGIAPADPVALFATPLVLGGVSYLACYLPARRAASVDPLSALREE
jgi:predicted permease